MKNNSTTMRMMREYLSSSGDMCLSLLNLLEHQQEIHGAFVGDC